MSNPNSNPVTQVREGEGKSPERTTRSERVVFSTGDIVIKIVEEEYSKEIRKRVYPIYPYGNHYEDVIRLSDDKLEYFTVRMNWNGTGRDDHGYVELDPVEREYIEYLIENVASVEDFNKLIEAFSRIKNEREKIVERLWEKLENKLLELIAVEEKVRTLNLTEEELREKVNAFIEYLVGE